MEREGGEKETGKERRGVGLVLGRINDKFLRMGTGA